MFSIVQMLKRKSKKGAAHFEMIIGFVFFVGFVSFLFLFLSPWDSSSLQVSALSGLYNSFEERAYTNLSSVFIEANYTLTGDCFYIDLPEEIFRYGIQDENSFVTRLGGVSIDSGLMGGDLNLDSGDDFFRVAISPEFTDENVSSCDNLSDFELGGVVELRVFSYSALVEMNNSYYSDYAGLKKDLRLPSVFDFAIVPEGMPEIVMSPVDGVPYELDILAKDYVVKVLKSDGSVSNERFSLRVW